MFCLLDAGLMGHGRFESVGNAKPDLEQVMCLKEGFTGARFAV